MNDNEQRDELALDIFLADNGSLPEGELRQDWADAPDQHRPYAQNIADGLTAKGYRKPRTITTVEELDALTDEAVVRSDFGVIHEKRVEFDTSRAFWVCPGDTDEHTAGKITLPATVLQEPTTEATR